MQGLEHRQDLLQTVYYEWTYLQRDARQWLVQLNDLDCPACFPDCHSLHCDANMKLTIWLRNARLWQIPYDNMLFLDDALARQHCAESYILLSDQAENHRPLCP